MSITTTYITLEKYLSAYWPHDILEMPDAHALDSVWIGPSGADADSETGDLSFSTSLLFEQALHINFGLIDGLAIVFGTADLTTEIAISGSLVGLADPDSFDVALSIGPLPITVIFDSDFLTPADADRSQTPPTFVPREGEPVNIEIASVTVSAHVRGEMGLDWDAGVALAPVFIGDSGVVIEAEAISLYLSDDAPPPVGMEAGWRGVKFEGLKVWLPEDLADLLPAGIELPEAYFGSGGFTGVVQLDENVTDYDEANAKSLFGFSFTLQSINLEFKQNALLASAITGFLKVPFFDEVLKTTIGLTNDGDFTASVASDEGLLILEKEGVVSVEVNAIQFIKEDEQFSFQLSGKLTPQIGDLDWPSFDVNALTIRSDGTVKVDGGWIDLPEPKALDLYGFRMEISQIGFGNEEDGRRWIGFSGGVHLVDMLPTGASVKGLRVIWDPTGARAPEIKLQGVGFELTIPGVMQLSGEVSLINDETEHVFTGDAKLSLLPLGIGLDASLKIGHDTEADFNYLYTFLSLQLPIGIPLWATGAAIYGLSGLYGMNVSPTTRQGDWYGWYLDEPKFDVTNTDKWAGELDGRAFGAGLVLGTLFDGGRVVSAKALFAMVLPGPTILLDGKANVLQLPPELTDASSEGIFDALAVLDAQAGNLQLDINAGWNLAKVVDINASAEAYFDFASPRNWHLYLGQDKPDDRRIRAYVISLFHADAYLMIDSHGIAEGFGVNWGEDWRFGPVRIVARAWIEAGAGITWQPPQLEGSLSLGGEFEVSIAGFGVGLAVEASLSGKAPTLYWVKGDLHLQVKLPVPIKDLNEDILLEWKQDEIPPSEDPFKTIGLEHLKVDETWTDVVIQTSAQLFEPNEPGYLSGPIVPLDARPSITFDRAIKDVTPVDLGSLDVYSGGTKIGDHTFDYELRELILEKWPKAGGTAWLSVEDLYGAWMATEDGNGAPAATRLQLWTKSPFAFTRQSSRTYRDAFLAAHLGWPCAETPEQVLVCVDWESELPLTEAPFGEYPPAFEHEGLSFIVETKATVDSLGSPVWGVETALSLADNENCWIVFPEPVRNVQVCFGGLLKSATAYANGASLEKVDEPRDQVMFSSEGIDSVKLKTWDNEILCKICYETEATAGVLESTQDHIDRLVAGLTHWNSEQQILEPETWYRLTVRLATVRAYKGENNETLFERYGYFQTAGPPALTPEWSLTLSDVSEPLPAAGSLTESLYPSGGLLTDLSRYIEWAIPANGTAPVYRAYDVGVDFNEDYVEQMYGADMAIRLLDANGQPLIDDEGNEIAMVNQWGEAPIAELTETELPYVARVADCRTLPGYSLPSNQKLIASNGILLEDDFSAGLDQWTEPNGDPMKPMWSTADGKLQFVNPSASGNETLLVAGDAEWIDYAVEVQLSEDGDEVGIVFRYTDTDGENYYRLRLDSNGRRFERVSDEVTATLWEDAVPYVTGTVDSIGVQCQGDRLRSQLDDELLFDLHDVDGLLAGKVGIYANSATATFEYFLVRKWPGGPLAPQMSYTAQLLASYVLFQGGLTSGWIDTAFLWDNLTRNKNHLSAIGRADWDDYCLEVNVTPADGTVGALVRFAKHPDGTFDAYRLILIPDSQTLRLARLHGTYSGVTYDIDDSGRTELWSSDSIESGVDFTLTEHSLALRCEGATLTIEVDGLELAQVIDENPLLIGQAGLYYEGDAIPEFTDLIIRSAPRQPVYEWSFVTSEFEGLVEQMDSFVGEVNQVEAITGRAAQLAHAITAALAAMERVNNSLESARQLLASAAAEDVSALRADAQTAASDQQAEAAERFATLDELFFDSAYRPNPPVVELSEVMTQVKRRALLLESPEPLDWARVSVQVARRDEASRLFSALANVLLVWNEDGTKAFIALGDEPAIAAGEYRVQFSYSLDIGLEAPALRRAGSTLPEVAMWIFSLS
jgi:hypothetical protein